jgi:hypothetical protein
MNLAKEYNKMANSPSNSDVAMGCLALLALTLGVIADVLLLIFIALHW